MTTPEFFDVDPRTVTLEVELDGPVFVGPQGPAGPAGPAGTNGVGVPAGGTSGQALTKNSATDYDTGWLTIVSGGGAPSGPAGGSLSGTYPNPTLASANLTSIGGLTFANNSVIRFTGPGTAVAVDSTTDWLTQYPALAGRGASQNLIGGTSGTGVLILQGDAANNYAGGINLRSPVRLRDVGGAGETLTADPAPLLRIRQNHTVDFATGSFGGGVLATSPGLFALEATILFNQSSATIASAFISNTALYKNVSGVAANLGSCQTVNSRPTYQADGATINLGAVADLSSRMTFDAINSGVLNPAADFVNFEGMATVNAGVTVPQYRSFVSYTLTGAGTITNYYGFAVQGAGAPAANAIGLSVGALITTGNNIGIDVAAPSGGATNIGIRSAGSILHSGTTGMGFTTGAGGTVVQGTSRTTTVVLNKPCGQITLFSAAGVATWTSFTVTNTTVAANDGVDVCVKTATNTYTPTVTAVAAGSFVISFAAVSGTATDAPVFTFTVTKAVTA